MCVLIYQHLFIWGKLIIHEERLRALRLFAADPRFLCNNFLRPVCFVHSYAERNKHFQSSSSKSGSVLWWEDLLGKWYVCQENMSTSNQICDVNVLFQRNWSQPVIPRWGMSCVATLSPDLWHFNIVKFHKNLYIWHISKYQTFWHHRVSFWLPKE